jgi:hypothetical protein
MTPKDLKSSKKKTSLLLRCERYIGEHTTISNKSTVPLFQHDGNSKFEVMDKILFFKHVQYLKF